MSKKKLNELERLKQENAKLRRQNLKLTVENAYIKNWMPWFKKERANQNRNSTSYYRIEA
ncbi:hypothetical protein [Lactobacillus helveticus]|nr:hypothetical protein [Lactobacillus helveticus]NRN90449.1 hypothetical protein [Lactobacillus helveticus]NRN94722.1 hypothetical protein [Lactobacillus helveticus]NRO07333.1 hypothetical protein [Lactobacillus helveticus]NRO37866.1 hypothetical protein [Lactobacillus helveticus]NRO45830.1 hypothetical protein [Lactobacillus helveticus]